MKLAKHSQLFLLTLKDFSLEVWDFNKFGRARKLKGHMGEINDAFFSSDNKFVFTCSQDYSLKIWDLIGGQIISDIKLLVVRILWLCHE